MLDSDRDLIRGYVGDEPSDAVLDELWALHGTVPKVALSVLSKRLGEMRDAPLRVAFEGDVTEDYTENLKALERQVRTLAPLADAGGSITTGRLVRPSTRR